MEQQSKKLNIMEKSWNIFMWGCLIGIVISFIAFTSEEPVIQTNKRIVPEWKLTTDGKKVDTLYIYKSK